MDSYETKPTLRSPSLLSDTSDSQTQSELPNNPSLLGATNAAQMSPTRAPAPALRLLGEEQTTTSPGVWIALPPDPFVGFHDLSRNPEDPEFDSTLRTESSEPPKTAPAYTALLRAEKVEVAVNEHAAPAVGSTTPSVHFPDTLPVPVHEHHHNHHHYHHTQNHHYSHHHHRSHHLNTPASPLSLLGNPMDEAAGITTPLPSYPSSPRISANSSMRSLITSLGSPASRGSMCNEYHSNLLHNHILYDCEEHTSETFGYRLGRRLDTLASVPSTDQNSPAAETAKCIHSMRRGIPMKMPFPTLAKEERRRRGSFVRAGGGSHLRGGDTSESTNQEGATSDEDPYTKLTNMLELQIHRTFDQLKTLSEELEGFTATDPQPPTPGEPQPESPLTLPVAEGQKHSETITLSQNASTDALTSLKPSSTAPILHQLVFQRAAADPQDLRQLAELNMRLLRNLQASLRKLDKLRILVQEHVANGTGEGDGTDPEDEDTDSENSVFIPNEREGARKNAGRRRSESQEREAVEKEVKSIGSKEFKRNTKKGDEKKNGVITVVTRALGLAKSRTSELPKINTSNTIPDNFAPGVPTGAIAPIPICNTFHPGSLPIPSLIARRRTLTWPSFWRSKKQSAMENPHPSPESLHEPYNGMHGSCCTCGDKHRQNQVVREKTWEGEGFWKKRTAKSKKRGIEWVPMGSGGLLGNKGRTLGTPLRDL